MRPFTTSRITTVRLSPPRLPGGIKGSTNRHSLSVRSLGYRRLDGAGCDQGRSGVGRHSSRSDVDRRPEKPWLCARGGGLPGEARQSGQVGRTLTGICGSTAGHAFLVDDDDVVRRSVRQALEPIGWKLTEAENGQVAIEAMTAGRPDIIILDLMMPKMDGFEFLDDGADGPNGRTSRSWSSPRRTSRTRTVTASMAGSSSLFKRATARDVATA